LATTQKRNESGHHHGATDVFRHKKRRLPFILLNFLNHTIILGFINSPKIKIDRKFGLFLGTSEVMELFCSI